MIFKLILFLNTAGSEGRSRSKSIDKSKANKPRARRKRQTIDTADLASIANSLEKPAGEDMSVIKSEPAATQTEYAEKKEVSVCLWCNIKK